MRGPLWHATAEADNAALDAVKDGEAGATHVVTSVYAGFDDNTTDGITTLTVDGTDVVTLHFVGQIALNNIALELPDSLGDDVGITLTASGAPGTFGSVLVSGYTK